MSRLRACWAVLQPALAGQETLEVIQPDDRVGRIDPIVDELAQRRTRKRGKQGPFRKQRSGARCGQSRLPGHGVADDQKRSPCQEGTVDRCLIVPRDIGHVDSGGVDA
jgi:hypothetical protein